MEDYKFVKALLSHTTDPWSSLEFHNEGQSRQGVWIEPTQRSAFSGQVTSVICLAHYSMGTLHVLYCTANSFHMKIKVVGRNVFSLGRNENWDNLLQKDIWDRQEARTDPFGGFPVEKTRKGAWPVLYSNLAELSWRHWQTIECCKRSVLVIFWLDMKG